MGGGNIRIRVNLHTILRLETDEGLLDQLEVDVPPRSTIRDICAMLGIDLPEESILFALNGRVVGAEQALTAGDSVDLIPAISGGFVRITQL